MIVSHCIAFMAYMGAGKHWYERFCSALVKKKRDWTMILDLIDHGLVVCLLIFLFFWHD